MAPRLLTSLKSSAYCKLSRGGGGSARNCEELSMAIGLITESQTKLGAVIPGAGGAQAPGPLPSENGTTALRPSPALDARYATATLWPRLMPSVFDVPSGIALSEFVLCVSRYPDCDGKSVTRTVYAASIAAASFDAPAGTLAG